MVESDGVIDVGRETLFCFGHQFAHTLRSFHRVAPRKLITSENGGRLSVESAFQVVTLRTEIDPRDVFHPHKRSVRICSNDDLAEFLRGLQPSLCADRVGKFLSAWDWFTPNLSSRIHVVLLLHRADDVGHGDAEFRELIWFYPEPHRILTRAKHLHIGNSRNARELIDEINVAVVGEENPVVGSLR